MEPPDYTFDKARLAALEAYAVLDTPGEPGFDDVVALAAQICGTPVALVSLVAADRQWFKARVGFEACETDLARSVCAHALVEPDLLVIPDLRLDPRSRANPLVTGAPHIRFYAGAPLVAAGGEVLGSLCVIDGAPRPQGLSAEQASGLRGLARQVMAQLELRRALAERDEALATGVENRRLRRESEAQYRTLFEAIDEGFCLVEMKIEGEVATDYRFIEVNPAFAAQTGIEDAEGRWMRDIEPQHEQRWFDLYGEVALTGRPARFERFAEHLGGRWFDVQAFRVGDAAARQVAILFSDVTERKARQASKERAEEAQAVLNQELSHRMKNLLAMVQAIANQTLRGVAERRAVKAFSERLQALSRAHEVLLARNWHGAQLSEVVSSVLSSLSSRSQVEISGPPVALGPRATLSLSLLVYELGTNAVKYGALSVETGRVKVEWRLEEADGEATVVLDWVERGGPPVTAPGDAGFGSKLIRFGLIGTGGADLRFEPSGLTVRFRAALSRVQEARDPVAGGLADGERLHGARA